MSRAAAGGATGTPPPAPAVVLVEGRSDAAVLEVLARRRGADLAGAGVRVLPTGGATGTAGALRGLDPAPGCVLALCDEAEAPIVRRALAAGASPSALFVCRADLEDELLRAVGEAAAWEVLESTGTAASFRTLQRQPAHRGRPFDRQLHRFLGAGAGRKALLGAALAERADPWTAPPPLAALLDRLEELLLPLGGRPSAAG